MTTARRGTPDDRAKLGARLKGGVMNLSRGQSGQNTTTPSFADEAALKARCSLDLLGVGESSIWPVCIRVVHLPSHLIQDH